jgi:hypothetical protein
MSELQEIKVLAWFLLGAVATVIYMAVFLIYFG